MDRFEETATARLEELGGIDRPAFAASFNLFRLATQYLGHLEAVVHRPHGLSTAGFRVLFTVWVYDELEPRQIARLSGVSTAAVSGVLGTLEAKDLVDKRRDPADRRLVQVRLTSAGEELVTSAYRMQNADEQHVFADLEPDELAAFTDTLRTMLERLS